jgi:prenyltransferase beta subunit
LARSLARFAIRLQVTWRTSGSAVAPLVLVAVLAVALSGATARAGGTPATYLRSAQNADGGFGPAPGQPSTQLFSGWAALGLAALGESPAQVNNHGPSLLGYLRGGVGSDGDPGSLERTILAAVAAGADPRRFGGRDLVAALEAVIARNGSVADQTNLTVYAILALRAAGIAPAANTLAWLTAQEDRDGGFNYATAGSASDVDDTGAALEALAGNPSPAAARARSRAVAFIERAQSPDGGLPTAPGAEANAQSTAWAIQGLVAAGVDPASLHRGGAPSPLAYLKSLIAPDGHVRYSRTGDQTPVWVTAEAAMALAEKPLPLAAVTVRKHPRRHRLARTTKQPKTVHHERRRAARLGHRGVAPADTSLTMGLATDAGILDALALAPIGVG